MAASTFSLFVCCFDSVRKFFHSEDHKTTLSLFCFSASIKQRNDSCWWINVFWSHTHDLTKNGMSNFLLHYRSSSSLQLVTGPLNTAVIGKKQLLLSNKIE